MINKTAILTGITGQDGSYLAELLLSKNYTVIGLHRRSSSNNTSRLYNILNNTNLHLIECDITDPSSVFNILCQYKPDEFYNLAAQSHVQTSFSQPSATFNVNTLGVTNILEAIRLHSMHTKFYQASTSEMFGSNYDIDPETGEKYQDENTTFLPQSPYGISKLASHRMVQLYRQAYNMFVCSGILFNHESPRRGELFVTRKITKYLGSLVNNKTRDKLKLGNLYAYRDWGHAKDYVYGMWLMLQQEQPDDFVLCSNTTHSVKDFLELAFDKVNLDYKDYVEIDPSLCRPAEVDYLKGSSNKANTVLGWYPKISFDALVDDMINADVLSNEYKTCNKKCKNTTRNSCA